MWCFDDLLDANDVISLKEEAKIEQIEQIEHQAKRNGNKRS